MGSNALAVPTPPRSGLLRRLSSFSLAAAARFSINNLEPAVADTAKQTGSSDSEDEEEPLSAEEQLSRVEHLLFTAQMDLISRRNSQAISKLNKAVRMGSSAACATLANLLSRGVTNPAPPAQSPPLSASQPLHHYLLRRRKSSNFQVHQAAASKTDDADLEGLAAAKLYITGLEIELAKPVERVPVGIKARGRDGNESGSETDDSEGETVEGREIDLDRVLELVLGLTDSYRFGILLPPTSFVNGSLPSPSASSFSSFPTSSSLSSTLFDSGARVAARALSHPLISPNSSPPHHSYLLATKNIATIQVHLLYLLAIHAFPTNRMDSERCWKQILEVGGTGSVTSREGVEIVTKAAIRLSADEDVSWKLVKKKNKIDTLVTPQRPPLKKKASRSSSDKMASSAITIRPDPSSASVIPTHYSSPIVSVSPHVSKSPKFHFGSVVEDAYPSPPATPPADVNFSSVHFDDSEGGSTTLFSPDTSIQMDQDEEPLEPPVRPKTLRKHSSIASFHPPPNLPRLLSKRAESITSISTLPPDFFSSRSVNPLTEVTLAPPHLRSTTTSSSGLAQYSFTPGEDPSDLEADDKPKPEPATGWRSSIKQRLRTTSSKIASTIFNSGLFKTDEEHSGAMETLRDVLKKDDASAGPGMYWGTEGEEEKEGGEDEQEVLERPKITSTESYQPQPSTSKLSDRPTLRATRSFFDPTTSSRFTPTTSEQSTVSSSTPVLVTTPPTPEKNANLLRLPNAPTIDQAQARVRSRSRSKSKSRGSGDGDIDPYLLELERNSRVGAKTTCATCGTMGLNFPACPRCKETYCTRECRISVQGGGDGVKHSCGSSVKGKRKLVDY